MMGTRFIATAESSAPAVYRDSVVAGSADGTTLTEGFSGRWARGLRNAFTERWADSRTPVLPFFWQLAAGADIYRASAAAGDPDWFPMWAGQSAGLVRDLPPAGDVVRRTVTDARRILDRLTPADRAGRRGQAGM